MFDVLSSESVFTAFIFVAHDFQIDSVIMDILSDLHGPKRPQCSNWLCCITLFPMQDVHPSDCLGIVDFAEIDLGSLQILVPQDDFRYDFQGHTVSAGIGG